MTKYKSVIKLGQKYRDERSGIEGHAVAIMFHSTGCNEVSIEFTPKSGEGGITGSEPREKMFAEARLTPVDVPIIGMEQKEETYKSDIKLDEYYKAEKEGIEGRAAYLEFNEHMANRVALQVIQTDRMGNITPKTWLIDEYRLRRVKDDKPVEKQEGQRGPAIEELDSGFSMRSVR